MRRLVDEILKETSKGIREWLDIPAPKMTPHEMLAYPDPRPQAFDISMDFYLDRISLWGKLKFYYSDTFYRVKNQEITRKRFLELIRDEDMLKMFGIWDDDAIAHNKILFTRTYKGLDGKKHKQELLIVIDLREELKNALRRAGFKP
jgi:hypothetical protein